MKKYIKIIICMIMLLSLTALAAANENFKYTDQNGLEFWLDDKDKIPLPMPAHYKYEDKNGLIFWVDDINKIPSEYRNKIAHKPETTVKQITGAEPHAEEKKQYSTKIFILDNVITVPVLFNNKGRKVKANMILDTGASVTTIYTALASKLNLNKNKLSRVRSINANGDTSNSVLTKVDHIEVGDKILSNVEVVVIPSNSYIGADGLLGNSFLRYFNFTIDYENQLLRWN